MKTSDSSDAMFMVWRFYIILGVIATTIVGLSFRVFNLAILDQHFLRHQSDIRVLRLVKKPALRGMIVDRNGFPLAVSTTVYSIWINPQDFNPSTKLLSSLSHLIDVKPKEILAIVNQSKIKKREFVYLKRSVSPLTANQIKQLDIDGVYAQEEFRRYYPEGETTAHVIGFTNIDDQGQEGLELSYNQWLSGEPGKKWAMKDRLGRVIADVKTISEQKPGHQLVLSIDRRIQYLAYRELLAGVKQNKASSGSAIVLDVRTGEVLAMVNQPSFNPNSRPVRVAENFRNRAVTDTFEPGSTIKAFTVATALDSGHFKPNSVIDTAPGWIRVGHNVMHDEKNNGLLSIKKILEISSNVGIAKIILALPPQQLWNLLNRVGFGEVTGISLPGEQDGVLTKRAQWPPFTLGTLAIGYGMTVTCLQLAKAYGVLANDGVKIPISILRLDKMPDGQQVIETKIAKQMLLLLESVVTEKGATGGYARIPGFRVAGKSGTTWLVGEEGYQKHNYHSSFVGIAPLSHPRLVVAVVMHDPQGKKYYGGQVAGPVFQKIMEGTLRILSVPPDALN